MSTKKKKTAEIKKADSETKQPDLKVESVVYCTSGKFKKEDTPKECPYRLGHYTATRFMITQDGKMKRQWKRVYVFGSQDIREDTSKLNDVINDFMTKDLKDNWHFDDQSAMEEALMDVEHILAQGAVSIEYGDAKCSCCISRKLRNLTDALRTLRLLNDKRREIVKNIDFDKGDSVPSCLPPVDELNDWDVVDGVYKNVSPVNYELTKEQSDEIAAAISKITGDKLSGRGAIVKILK